MKALHLPLLLGGLALSALDPGAPLAPALLSALPQTTSFAPAPPSGGARVSQAEAERMIQDRENHLRPSLLRRDFAKDPGALHGWSFNRKAILAMLDAMKDKSDGALVYIVMGHAEDLDPTGNPIPGSWHETLILCESRPFSAAVTPYDYFLQHPNTWP